MTDSSPIDVHCGDYPDSGEEAWCGGQEMGVYVARKKEKLDS